MLEDEGEESEGDDHDDEDEDDEDEEDEEDGSELEGNERGDHDHADDEGNENDYLFLHLDEPRQGTREPTHSPRFFPRCCSLLLFFGFVSYYHTSLNPKCTMSVLLTSKIIWR